MKVKPKKVKGSTRNPSHTTLTDADIDRFSAAITTAITAAQETPKPQEVQEAQEPPAPRKKTAKEMFKIFFWPIRKLKVQDSALSLVKIVTSVACQAISRVGYVLAILMVVIGVLEICKSPNLNTILTTAIQTAFAIVIWLMSRLLAATGWELEQTNNENLVFGVSAFILAIIAIIVSM